jgi:hypothetical protein
MAQQAPLEQDTDTDTEQENNFPELLSMINMLEPLLSARVVSGDVNGIREIIQNYNHYVDTTYSEHEAYDITPSITIELEDLGALAHARGYHEICDIFENDDCTLSGATEDRMT